MTLNRRKVIIQFLTASGEFKELDGIEVRFDVAKFMSSVMNKATIDICNLARSDIEFLTTYTSQYVAINQRKRIRLLAGYADTGTGAALIFDGDIIEARPTNPPDIWLHCQALSGYYNNKDNISYSYIGETPATDIIKDTADKLGLAFVDGTDGTQDNLTVVNWEFTGPKTQIISELNEVGNYEVFEDDGKFILTQKGQPRNDTEVVYIDETSGLVGIPNPDAVGVSFRVLLDNSLKIKQKIYLQSNAIPGASGLYWIYEMHHKGDLRGNDFYTDIKARRM